MHAENLPVLHGDHEEKGGHDHEGGQQHAQGGTRVTDIDLWGMNKKSFIDEKTLSSKLG